MTTASPGRRRPIRTRPAVLAAACGLAVLLAACSNTTGGSGSSSSSPSSGGSASALVTASTVNQQALAATIKKTFLTDIPVSQLNPAVADAMAAASQPLTPQQDQLFHTCLQQSSCDTGHGSLTVAIALESSNAWDNIFRAEATQQALAYPQVKRIIYNNANGDISAVLANLRSLVAQQVDIIVTDPVFGGAIQSAVQQAKQAGVTVVTVNTPVPPAVGSLVAAQIPTTLCQMYTQGAQALIKAFGSKGTYALYTGIPGNSNAAAWQPCATKTLNAAGWTESTVGYTQWTAQGAAQAADALLASGKHPDAIIYDYTTEDFLKPYVAAHRTPPAFLSDTMNYAWLTAVQQAKQAGVPVKSWLASGHVFFGRLGVTAAVEIREGKHVDNMIPVHIPVVPADSVLDTNSPSIPSDVPVSSLLTPQQMTWALAAP
jgi:ABC-type sugar transport system substrate-binding protein